MEKRKVTILVTTLLMIAFLGMALVGCSSQEQKKGAEDIKTDNSKEVEDKGYSYSKDEILDIFYRNEEEFNYVVEVLKKLEAKPFYVVISEKDNETVWYYKYEHIDVGYEYDEKFEECVRKICIDEGLDPIYTDSKKRVDFGGAIKYSETGVYIDPPWDGEIKDNWYYHIQSQI